MSRNIDHLSIGLFGGSFNPAHSGHLHVARAGLRELQLDHIWWLASPQNPLKPKQPSYESRVETIKALGLPPRMSISNAEIEMGSRYTVDLIKDLQRRYPRTRFVFLMGADNFSQLPQWKDWQGIINRVPIAVIARPQAPIKARLGQAARQFEQARLPESRAHSLQYFSAPCWTYLTLPLNSQSSSALRAREP